MLASPEKELKALKEKRERSNGEEILSATLEEEMLAEARSYSPYFSYRRPELYGPLTEPC